MRQLSHAIGGYTSHDSSPIGECDASPSIKRKDLHEFQPSTYLVGSHNTKVIKDKHPKKLLKHMKLAKAMAMIPSPSLPSNLVGASPFLIFIDLYILVVYMFL